MKPGLILGLLLVILGALGLYFRGIPYTKKENVFQVGDIRAQVETKETFEIHPAFSALVLAGGVGLLIISTRKKT
jgi:hypothetical protein